MLKRDFTSSFTFTCYTHIVGLGNGMLFFSSSVILQQYFELTRWLVETLGWRGAILILSAIYMHGTVVACLLNY